MPDQEKTPRRTVRVADELWKPAKQKAAANHEHITDVIRRALTAYLASDNTEK